ncbi:MAG: hypothetical protein FD163_283 [Hyphomonadaceae bacterium]|nr:MAG: hypothetical protein FD163_283 [Hyphomonadaceae bacterium]
MTKFSFQPLFEKIRSFAANKLRKPKLHTPVEIAHEALHNPKIKRQAARRIAKHLKPRTRQQKVMDHLIQALGSANAFIMFFIIFGLLVVGGIRYGAMTPDGKAFIVERFDGMRLGPMGTLQVQGLEGDFFTEFDLKYAAIKDQNGIWIEGRNFQVNWNFLSLLGRQVHINDIKAELINIHRRPILAPRRRIIDSYALSLKIEQAQTPVQTFAAFSGVHGLWGLAGNLSLSHDKDLDVDFHIVSAKRRSDRANGNLLFQANLPMQGHVYAREAGGGGLGGSLGLNANLPLLIDAELRLDNDDGIISVVGFSGGQKLADVKGRWNEESGGGFAGVANFSASRFTSDLAERFGSMIAVNSVWRPIARSKIGEVLEGGIFRKQPNNHFYFSLVGNNAKLELRGDVDFDNRKTVTPLATRLSMSGKVAGGPNSAITTSGAGVVGKTTGDITDWRFDGVVHAGDLAFPFIKYRTVTGALQLARKAGVNTLQYDLSANGGTGNSLLATALGSNTKSKAKLTMQFNGSWQVEMGEIIGNAGNLRVGAGQNLFGNANLRGSANLDLSKFNNNQLKGTVNSGLILHQSNGATNPTLEIDAEGSNVLFGVTTLNELIGARPKLNANIIIGPGPLRVTALKFTGNDLQINGQSSNRANAVLALAGTVAIGNDALAPYKIRGNVNGTWGFADAGANSPPFLSFNLAGNNISSNNPSIARVLGNTPHLQGLINFVDNGINIRDTRLNGEDIQFQAGGQYSYSSGYDLALDWTMNGPLFFGPLAVDGNLNGSGKLRGTSNQPNLELRTRINQLVLGPAKITPATLVANMAFHANGFSTNLALSGNTEFGDIEGTAAIIAINDGFELRNIDIHGAGVQAQGSAKLSANNNPSADLNIEIGRGAFLQNGNLTGRIRLNQSGNETLANIALAGSNFTFRGNNQRFTRLSVAGSGPLSNLILRTSFTTLAPMNTQFEGTTLIRGNNQTYDFALNGGGRLGNRNFTIEEPISLELRENEQKAKGKIVFAGQADRERGLIDFEGAQSLNRFSMRANVRALSLALLHQDFLGAFSGTAVLEGEGAALNGRLNGVLANAHARGLGADMALSGNIDAQLANNIIGVKLDATNPQGLDLDVDANLPVVASAAPLKLLIERTRPINGHYKALGEVRPLADIVFAGERILGGHIDAQGTITGSINEPNFIGNFALERGNFREPTIGLNLSALKVKGTTDSEKISISEFSGRDGAQGTISGSGEIGTGSRQASILRINTHNFKLVDTDTAEISATSQVTVERAAGQPTKLTGEARIDFAEFSPRTLSGNNIINIDVEEINRDQRPISAMPARRNSQIRSTSSQPNVEIDVKLTAPRGVFVRGSGLNLELSLDARARGTLGVPQLTGLAKVHRGEYEYAGRSFLFDENGTITLAANPNNIRLNLLASRRTSGLDAKIRVTGTAVNPIVTLTSTPELPPDEILSQVLFGRSRAQLSTIETVQLAASLASLASGGGFDIMANLRDIAKLDRLVFGNTATGEISVAGGKYLGRDVYVELISEGTQGVSTNVEWRPNNSTAIASRVGTTGDGKISIRWRRDFR